MYKNLVKLALIAALVMPATSVLALDVISPDKPKPKKNKPTIVQKAKKGKATKRGKKAHVAQDTKFCQQLAKINQSDLDKASKIDAKLAEKNQQMLIAAQNRFTEQHRKNAVAIAHQTMLTSIQTALTKLREAIKKAGKTAQAACAVKKAGESVKIAYKKAVRKTRIQFNKDLQTAQETFRKQVEQIANAVE